jgi:hypothetical protein
MKNHSESLSIYKNFSTMIRTEQDTLAQLSCPGAHAQNGVAERKHRHLLEAARALMIASSIPSYFWAKAILLPLI